MRKSLTIIIFLCIAGFGYAQDQPAGTTPPQQPQQKNMTAGQVLSVHAARTYQLALRYNDYIGARMALYDLLAENPASDSILYTLSVMFLETGQYASAAIAATDLEKMNPDHLGGIEIRAVAFENLGVLDKAADNYEDLYFKTGNFQSLYKVSFLQYQLKRYNESMTNIDVMLEKKESEELTAIFESTGDTEKEYPLKVALYNLKGLNALGLNNKEAARQHFQKALELAPDFQLAKENLESLNN